MKKLEDRLLSIFKLDKTGTIFYFDASTTTTKSLLRVLCRWRGSIWKATLKQLCVWTILYMAISILYRYVMSESWQRYFEALSAYLNNDINTMIPLTFMLGFFVASVVKRWSLMLNSFGWIDDSAIAIATFIRDNDEDTLMLKRNLIRYMVLNQALVLRDISIQVRYRFPTLETLVAAGLLTTEELKKLISIPDVYSQYWLPIQWVCDHLVKAHQDGKIKGEKLLDTIIMKVQKFREGLSELLRYDWVPIPLVYPQVILFSVRLYFGICLISRQFLLPNHAKNKDSVDLWIPFTTMLQFIVYMGWMKVAEALMNPLGEDDDDLECNYVIDKNLITGLTIVDHNVQDTPPLRKDAFWGSKDIIPLYSMDAAERSVHPLEGSASKVNLVKNIKTITMVPNKTMLPNMSPMELSSNTKVVNVVDHDMPLNMKKYSVIQVDQNNAIKRVKLAATTRSPLTTSATLDETEYIQ
uniref:Bestrophin homolog n=1 Tax=Acrobeloides nanus TaxID=290746 RepID=A0A914BWF8_9BILA